MKRLLFILAVLFLLVFGFVVSCPNGPEPSASVTVSFKSTVDRGDDVDSSYMLSNYKMWYKIYPSDTWSTELRGTVKDWTPVEDDRLVMDGVNVKSFRIGDLTPTDWTLEVKFTDEYSDVMYFYGKKERVSVTLDSSLLNLEGFIKPVIDENITGDFSVKVTVDDFSKIESGTLNFIYRYNNSNEDIWNGKTFNGEGNFEYTSSTNSNTVSKIVDLETGDVRGEIRFNKEDDSFLINLTDLPTGFYLYQVTHSFSTANSYVISSTDGTRIIVNEDGFDDSRSEINEGFIPVLVNGSSNNKSSVDLKVEANGYELKDDSNELINNYKTKIVNVDNNKDGSSVVILDPDVKKLIFIPKFRPKEGAIYSWSYLDPTDVDKVAITGEGLSFSLDFDSNDKIYDGTEVHLQTKSTNGTVLKSKVTIIVSYAINIVPELDNLNVVESVYLGTNPLNKIYGDTNYKFNSIGTDKIRVYLYDLEEIGSIDLKESEDGRKLAYIVLSKGWNKEISEDNVTLKTETGENEPQIIVGRTGRYFDFDMENTRSSLKLTLNPNPNTITFTLKKGKLTEGSESKIEFNGEDEEEKILTLTWSGKRSLDSALDVFKEVVGYEFINWKLNDKEISDEADFTDELENAKSNLEYILTAQWKPNTYKISFDKNAEDTATLSGESIEVVYDSKYGELPTASRTGYTFIGWFTEDDEEIKSASKVIKNSDHTLFAHWIANTYVVSFDVNGGNALSDNEIKKIKERYTYDSAYGDLPVVTRSGYEFVGWFTEDGKVPLTDTSLVKTAKNHTLYAYWSAKEYTVTFDVNGGNALSESEIIQTYDSEYNLPENPTKTGYTFSGWFNLKDEGTEVTSSSKVKTAVNHTLYAHWTVNKYTVTFDVNGGNALSKSEIIQTYDSEYNLPENPTRVGWTFIGWFTDKVNGEEIKASTKVETANPHTLYAHWLGNTVNVTLDLNTDISQKGWTEKLINSRASYNQNYEYKNEVKFTENYEILRGVEGVREGFNFLGWFDSKEGETLVTADSKVETAYNHTLYAHWKPVEYILTVDRSNEHVEERTEIKNKLFYGEKVEITATLKTGYKFVEWTSSKPDIVTDKFNATTTVIMPASDVTVTATVAPKVYTFILRDDNNSYEIETDYEKTEDLSFYATYFKKQGYTFTGWFYGNDNVVYISENTVKVSSVVDAKTEDKVYFKPSWIANEYIVTFDVNGGKPLSKTEIPQIYGEEYILPETAITREGYTFSGWYTNKDGGNLAGHIVSNASNHTLYAHWNPISYNIEFKGNGSTSGSTATITATYDKTVTLTANGFSKIGYTFAGWSTSVRGSVVYEDKALVKNNLTSVNNDIVALYAQWKPISYTIIFNSNDVKATGSTASVTAIYDDKTVALTANGFSKTGYLFAGWSTSARGSVVYEDKALVKNNLTSVNNGTVTLYAKWTPISYTIVFDKNDAKAIGSTAPITVKYDENVELINEFANTGYAFGGWNTEANGKGTKYTNGQLVSNLTSTNGSTVTLYAQWEADFVEVGFVVNLKFNGLLFNGEDVEITDALRESLNRVKGIKEMSSFKIGRPYGSLPELKATGWKFIGWYTDSEFTESSKVTPSVIVKEEISTLYAKWEPVSYALTLNGSDKISAISAKNAYLYGEEVGITAVPKLGYSFKDWTVNKGDVSLNNSSTVTISMPASDVSITANAEPIKYIITYKPNYNGSSLAGSMANTEAWYGENVYLRGNEFTRTGYTFKNWNTSSDGKGDSYSEYESVKNLSSSSGYFYLYAQWEPKKDIVLSFNANGIKYNDVNPSLTQISSIKVVYDARYWNYLDENKDGKLDDKYKPSSDYYKFNGWLTKDGILVDANTLIKDDKEPSLYADWEPKTLEISFDLKGNRSTDAEGYNYQLLYSDIKPEKVEKIRVIYGSKYEDLPILTSEGWEFLGWSINGNPISKGDTVDIKENSTAKAEWRPVTYKVTLESNLLVDKVERVQKKNTSGVLFASGDDSVYRKFDNNDTYYYGELVEIKATPRPGYKIDSWSGNVKTALFAGSEGETSKNTINFNMPSNDVNVSINASASAINVILDANEANFKGSNSSLSDSKAIFNGDSIITVIFGEKYPNDITEPKREGWKFSGWYLNQQCTESSKVESNTTVTVSTDHILYAKWEPSKYNLNVEYDANIESVSVTPLKESYNYGERVDISVVPKASYRFKEWDTADVTRVQNKDRIILNMPSREVTIKATSEPIEYVIVYDANGGVGRMDNEVVTYGKSHNLASNAFTYTGCEFIGWNANTNTYADGATIRNLTDKDGATVRLYAQWKEINYDLELKLNGGIGVELPKTYTVKTPSFMLGTPTKEGYVFKGWSGTGLIGEDNKSVKISKGSIGDRSYTANWAPAEYTISYYLKNGELDSANSVNKYTIESETFSITKTEPTREGYIFTGWTGSNGSTPSKDVSIEKESIGNKGYIANWEVIKYGIKYYDDLEEIFPSPECSSYTVEDAVVLPIAVKDGYVFRSWTDLDNGNEGVRTISEGNTGNKIYQAVWSDDLVTYYIHYDYDGGKGNNPEVYTINDKIELKAPTREGYVFIGWTGSNGNTAEPNVIIPKGSTGDKSYTANWDLKTYTVTLDLGDTTKEIEVTHSKRMGDLLDDLSGTRRGYNFIGWLTETGVEVTRNTVISEDLGKLHPEFEIINYSIKYNYNGGSSKDNPTTYNVNESVSLGTATRNGYKFNGWIDDETGKIVSSIELNEIGNKNFTANWTLINYTISYDLNGGNEYIVNPNSYTVENTLTLNNPTKNGYKFIGWTENNDSDTKMRATIVKGTTGDKNYRANWEVIEYNIIFNANGGQGDITQATYTIETGYELPTKDEITKKGYNFKGWKDDVNNTVTSIEKGEIGNKSFTADWELIQYSITYSLNGGYSEINPANYTVEDKDIIINNPEKEGYVFTGWKDIDGKVQKNVIIKRGSTGDIRLEATYDIINYTVFYKYDGGKLKEGKTNKTFYTIEDESFTLNNPEKLGYIFRGWTGTNGSVMQSIVSIPKGSTGNKAYYSNWEIVTHSISYENIDYDNVIIAEKPSSYDVTSVFVIDDPSRKGYTFNGWTESSLKEPVKNVYMYGESIWKAWTAGDVSDLDLKFVATWSDPILYTITYNLRGGSETTNPKNYTVESENIILNDPTRTGYTFSGWTGTNSTTPEKGVNIAKGSTGNKTYYANWTPITYAINYELNGGTASMANLGAYTIETETFTLNNPIRAGYNFKGWSGTELTGDSNKTVEIAKGSTGNKNYTANWTVINYSISYDLNNGSVSTANPNTYTVETKTFTLNNPTRVGYRFKGWSGTGLTGESNNTVKIAKGSTGNRTYTANWATPTEYIITYNLEGGSVNIANLDVYTVETKTFILNNPIRTGYTFKGWSGTGLTGDSNITVEVAKGSTGDRSYTANWTVIIYTIIYDLGGGKESTANLTEYNTETADFTLNNPTKTGYNFIGWTGSNGDKAQTVVKIKKGSVGDKNYTANWTPITYTVEFILGLSDSISERDQKVMLSSMYDAGEEVMHMVYDVGKYLPSGKVYQEGYTFLGWSQGKDLPVEWEDGGYIINLTDVDKYNVNLFAIWEVHTYTIVFNGNGNSGGSTASILATYDTSYRLTENGFTKNGYTFNGWNTKTDGSEISYEDKASVKNLATSGIFNLYAQWRANTYTIVFNGNGNSGGSTASILATYDTSYILTENGFTKTGYTFISWNTKVNGSGTSYGDKAAVMNLATSGRLNLYAQWGINTFTLEFNGNGSTGGFTESISSTYGVEITLPANGFIRTGYIFSGWSTSRTGEKEYDDKDSSVFLVPVTGMKITLYALWTPIIYTISYDLQSGTVSEDNPETYTVETEGFTLNNPTRVGYTFIGWTGYNGDKAQMLVEIEKGSIGNRKYTANWTPNIYTIAFNGNGHTDGSTNPISATYDISVTLTENGFEKTGYRFDSWNTASDGSGETYENKQTVKNLTSAPGGIVTLYAMWTPNKYIIAFDGNGNTGVSSTMLQISATYDVEVKLTLNKFVKTGYTFESWNTKADGSGKRYGDGEDVKNLTSVHKGVVTLYAQWEGIKYTIRFNPNDGEGNMSDLAMTYGTDMNLTANTFTRTGHVFIGWALTSGGIKKFDDKELVSNLTTKANDIVTLYALWELQSYTIEFNGNGASGGSMSSFFTYYGVEVEIPKSTFEKRGYTFSSWNTQPDGTGTTYSVGNRVKNLTSVHKGTFTLYAQWIVNSYTIRFNSNGGLGTMNDINTKYGESVILPNNSFTKPASTFKGWSTVINGDVEYNNGDSVASLTGENNGIVILYAVWNTQYFAINNNGEVIVNPALKTPNLTVPLAKTLTIPSNIDGRSIKSTSVEFFLDDGNVEEIIFENGYTVIEEVNFTSCDSLKKVVLPDTLEKISLASFSYCVSLEKIVLPNSLKEIGDYAFSYCANLKEIRYNGTVSKFKTITKGSHWFEACGTKTIICTDGTIMYI